VMLQLEFEDLPAGTKRIASLAGTVTLTQDQEFELKRIPLREGEAWETPEDSCRIASVKEEGGGLSVVIGQVSKQAAVGAGSSSSSSGSSSSGGGGHIDGPMWLSDEKGARILPHAVSSSSNNGNATVTLSFAAAGKPTLFVHRIVTKTSTRDLPFALKNVELP
jgi:hypothetical protein